MNNVFKILVILLLVLICLGVFYSNAKSGVSLIKVCPVNAISQVNNTAVIDKDKCINCGRCFKGIPNPIALFPKKTNSDSAADTPATPVQTTNNSSINNPSDKNETVKNVNSSKTGVNTPKINKTDGKTGQSVNSMLKTFFKVHPETCIGCGLCVSNCPAGAITLVDGKAVIDALKCTACGICANGNGGDFAGCPTTAISKVTEKINTK